MQQCNCKWWDDDDNEWVGRRRRREGILNKVKVCNKSNHNQITCIFFWVREMLASIKTTKIYALFSQHNYCIVNHKRVSNFLQWWGGWQQIKQKGLKAFFCSHLARRVHGGGDLIRSFLFCCVWDFVIITK